MQLSKAYLHWLILVEDISTATDFLISDCRIIARVLLGKLARIPFKSLLAFHATEIVGFSVIAHLESGCTFIQNRAAHGIARHRRTHPCPRGTMLLGFELRSSSLMMTPS